MFTNFMIAGVETSKTLKLDYEKRAVDFCIESVRFGKTMCALYKILYKILVEKYTRTPCFLAVAELPVSVWLSTHCAHSFVFLGRPER